MSFTLRRISRRLAAVPAIAASTVLVGVAGSLVSTPRAAAAPEPAPIPRRWQLEIEPSPLRSIVVDTPGIGPRAYFFMTYKVTNNSTSDLLFAPAFELATDDMAVYRSGRDVPVVVTNRIKELLNNPLLEDQISIVGTLLRGEENAKEGLVIWPIPAMHGSEMAIYCAGFSGETVTVEVPVPPPVMAASSAPAQQDKPKTEKKILRKTYELRYRLPGDLHPGSDEPLLPYEKRWIMR
jgi:hypothetical protein